MAETPTPQPEPQKVDIPPVVEENGRGGKRYRAFQKQNPDASTWESHVGSMLGSVVWISMATAGLTTNALGLLGLATTGILPIITAVAVGMGITYAGGVIGQHFGRARVEKENAEGKVYTAPSSLNRDAIEQGISGALVWKALTAIGLFAGVIALGYVAPGLMDTAKNAGFTGAGIILTGSLLAAAYGGIKGIFSGMSMGKARMEREYEDAALINALQTGKGVPVRAPATGIDSPEAGKVAGIVAGITSSVDPASLIHSIPILGEKANDIPQGEKAGGNRRYPDFSNLGDAHPAFEKKISFAQRELDKVALKEQQLAR